MLEIDKIGGTTLREYAATQMAGETNEKKITKLQIIAEIAGVMEVYGVSFIEAAELYAEGTSFPGTVESMINQAHIMQLAKGA